MTDLQVMERLVELEQEVVKLKELNRELVRVLRVVSKECNSRYCDNDNDNFLYDTYEYIEHNLDKLLGEDG